MTKLHAALGQRLPGSLSVGRGNALSLAGTCHAGTERIESLSVVANGVEAEVRAHGMPSPGTRDRTGTLWWGIVPIPEGTSGSTLRIGLRAKLGDGSDAFAELGEIELVSAPSTRPARRTGTAARPRATAATGTERGTRRAGRSSRSR